MPKIKLPTKQPFIDMTPMVDLFSILLIFFLLTGTFRAQEPAPVDTPFSISEKPTPDFNNMTIVFSSDNRVFFNIDNGPDTLLKFRPKILECVGQRFNIEFTPEELRKFEKYNTSIGVPIEKMKEFLNAEDPSLREALQTGIPYDSLNNQLEVWVLCARQINPAVMASLKGDARTEFPTVRRILDILQDKNVNRFNLVTSLRAVKVEDTENK
ncbi:MAG TPA: biopolymer transporter ExbD [Bacteroidales bacterium]|nr:biopolymer transporter ExbD [Bacteroidales bacterium]HOK75421.1 biopolymer transporter ExbD [Bacteroidales bacterium]HOM39682.1 biopolymer transporter ExbD [Bacteroidales bacterium]HPP92036.1 biopolymer transporter ExbD [Bacteroidales bacterium]HQG55716.1 biopolymer transporter ExbD [Bacteroidales bacterium]